MASVSIEVVGMAMQSLSKPKDSPLYIGEYVEGSPRSKLFYKCPPDRINPAALKPFNISFEEYTRLYYEPVPRNKCGNSEVYVWRLMRFHPFGPKAFPLSAIRDLPPEVVNKLQEMANAFCYINT